MGRKIVLIAALFMAANFSSGQALQEPKFQGPLFIQAFDLGETVVAGSTPPLLVLPVGFSGQRVRRIYCDIPDGTGSFSFAIRTGGPTAGFVRTIATANIPGPGYYSINVASAVFTENDFTVYIEITAVTTPGLQGLSAVLVF